MTQPLRAVPDVDPDSGEVIEHAPCTECTRLRGQLFNAEQDNRRLEKDLRTWREKYERAVEDKEAKLARDKFYPMAMGLIQEWKRECNHPNASETDPKRIQLALSVVKRYKNDRDKLSLVIQHGKHLAFVKDTGFKCDEFGRLFGSSDEIEKRATEFYLWSRKRGLS